jgi:hypothetical protein
MTVLIHFILDRHDLTVLAWFGSIKSFLPVINLRAAEILYSSRKGDRA